MRHFAHLPHDEQARLFSHRPEPFTRDSDVPTLAVALGATLYMPGTRENLARDLRRQASGGVTSSVVCLEDAVRDEDVPRAHRNVVEQLRTLSAQLGTGPSGDGSAARGQALLDGLDDDDGPDGPLVFVRVRAPEQIGSIVAGLGDHAGVLSGFVLPKFTETSGTAYLDALVDATSSSGRRLLAMPVLESPSLMHRETRQDELTAVARLLDKHRPAVLAVRIGATDLSGLFGIRRDRDLTVYDVRVVADLIGDVVNVLGRTDGSGHVVTGPVWEYFGGRERLFKPRLRQTPFEQLHAGDLRHDLLHRDLDGLIREVVLDRSNGLVGKTVIHPSHVGTVHGLSVVSHEDLADATDILAEAAGGVASSRYGNKMNESRPHRAWAERTLLRSRVFGVANEDISVVDLLSALTPS
ncbi:MAG TPA: HpcH/HpaI aldolase/citrate lyase family protein [Actinotalea sp.]